MKKILYISTNTMWGGSEELWLRSAKKFIEQGHIVFYAAHYSTPIFDYLKAKRLDIYQESFNKNSGIRILEKLKVKQVPTPDSVFFKQVKKANPDLIVISQGNNIGSAEIMNYCKQLNVPYVTITQLVSEVFWIGLNDALHAKLKAGYEKAARNFFVSKANLALHQFMFSYTATNNEVINNPMILQATGNSKYPLPVNNYSIAFVGRIECFHKGLDLLVQVLAAEKWKARPLVINLYGDGPHINIIKQQLAYYGINNVYLKGFNTAMEKVWQNNQILILPSRMEGQSLALTEALFCNRTAITTNVGGAAEIIEDDVTGFIAGKASLQDLDHAMERAWAKRDEWEKMGIAAGNKIRSLMPGDAVNFFNEKVLSLLQETTVL